MGKHHWLRGTFTNIRHASDFITVVFSRFKCENGNTSTIPPALEGPSGEDVELAVVKSLAIISIAKPPIGGTSRTRFFEDFFNRII
jgi:hypothetical protein